MNKTTAIKLAKEFVGKLYKSPKSYSWQYHYQLRPNEDYCTVSCGVNYRRAGYYRKVQIVQIALNNIGIQNVNPYCLITNYDQYQSFSVEKLFNILLFDHGQQ